MHIPPGPDTSQDVVGHLYKLRGHPVVIEDASRLFQADEIDWDAEAHVVVARGHVYFHSFEKNEEIWCDRLEYNTQDEEGKFENVRGETHPRIVTKPGVLASNNPFHFEGKWAERIGSRYLLYDGWVTNCKLPNPWWRLRGPKFEIVPGEHAKSYRSLFLMRRIPLFFTPFFYHSLQKEPRKSGFLPIEPGHSNLSGYWIGGGYYWAINRSYDATYRFQEFVSRGLTHHVDFRGKVRPGTDFDMILFGAQDRGRPDSHPPDKYSGLSIYAVGKTDLGGGWMARGYTNYITSFRFRQEWTTSFNEAIGSEIHSAAFLNKNWAEYSFNGVFSRLENFQTTEINIAPPDSPTPDYIANAVNIRKLPEAQFTGADRQLWRGVPLWFSFDSAAGLLFRSEPFFDKNGVLVDKYQTGNFTNRVNLFPHLTSALHFGPVHLVPSFGLRETFYSEAQTPYQDHYRVVGTNIVTGARDFSLDIVLPALERIFEKKTIFGDKLKHVIEPRVTYRYVTGIGDDFNKVIRFDETDLLTNTNEVALSLTNRIYAKRGDSVEEILTWELMQKRYFDPTFGGALLAGQRNVFAATADVNAYAFLVGPRSTSPVASKLRLSPISGVAVQWQADYDPRRNGLADSTLEVGYRWKKYSVFAGNNSVHTDPILTPSANQFRFRATLGDANHKGFNAAAETIYDYRAGEIQYSTFWASYNTDCCGVTLQYRRFRAGARDDSQWGWAFTIANIGQPIGPLRKQDRLF